MKFVAIVKFLFICLCHGDWLYHFKNSADTSLSVSSCVELEGTTYSTVLGPEQFFACNEYSINTRWRTQPGSNDAELWEA